MNKEIRALINLANSQKSTGPRTGHGKQRSAMNACKHNLTGSSLILQPDEMEAYNRLTNSLLTDLKPKSELERQMVQKIVDTNFRLNRIACIENNMFNFGLMDHSTDTPHDDRIEVMIAQTRAWIERSSSFDVLGRYEARLSRQLLQFTLELERLQKVRKEREQLDSTRSHKEIKRDKFETASFGKTPPELLMAPDSFRVLTNFMTAAHQPSRPAGPQIAETPPAG